MLNNSLFPHAAQTMKKITLLYSQNDPVLSRWYHDDKMMDEISIEEKEHLDSPWNLPEPNRATLQNELAEDKRVALGLNGPSQETIKRLGNRLIPANMTRWSTGHSYIRVPTMNVMKHGYKDYIMSKETGMQSFGLYDAAQFSLDKDDEK